MLFFVVVGKFVNRLLASAVERSKPYFQSRLVLNVDASPAAKFRNAAGRVLVIAPRPVKRE